MADAKLVANMNFFLSSQNHLLLACFGQQQNAPSSETPAACLGSLWILL